ncbi:MAG: GTP 3',8-cyclase MoaA [Candidatus Sericytochromatia bacterium]
MILQEKQNNFIESDNLSNLGSINILNKTEEKKVIDSYQRHIHKLRVQLTDACNFRCFYCMPENIKFKPHKDLLTPKEIYDICSILNEDFGIDELRITGGEPTIRPEFEEIVNLLSQINTKKLGLTTNAFVLNEKLDFLKNTNCKNINISLDSLNEEQFNKITKGNYFKKVFNSILKAKEMGFNVKINTVLLRNMNDNEILDFVNFSAKYDIEVRFLELMKIGMAYENNNSLFISASEIIKKIKTQDKLKPVKVSNDSTSFNYITSSGAKIGFIASESMPFCGSCSRLRLSATGKLRACLMSENGIDLKNKSREEYRDIIYSVIAMKPFQRIDHIDQVMNQIGG